VLAKQGTEREKERERGSGREIEREFFIDNLQVRIHLIIEMISVDRPRAIGVRIPFSR